MTFRRSLLVLTVPVLPLLGLASCDSVDPLAEPASLEVVPPADTLRSAFDSVHFSAQVTDADGRVLEGRPVDWHDPVGYGGLEMRQDGWVVSRLGHPSPIAIVARLGTLSDTAWLYTDRVPAWIVLDSSAVALDAGTATYLGFLVVDSSHYGMDVTPVWRSSDTTVMTVLAEGSHPGQVLVTARAEGEAWAVASLSAVADSAAVTVLPAPPVSFAAVDAGYVGHTCALSEEGRAYCWGLNTYGELGVGYAGNGPPLPTPVETDIRFVEIIAGNRHSCARTENGEVWCWGESLFNGGESPDICFGLPCTQTPRRVEDLPPVTSLHGTRGTCALTEAGEAWCFRTRPYRLFPDLGFVDLVTTERKYCGLTAEGEVWCDHRTYDEWPDGRPHRVASDSSFVSLTAGYSHYCALNVEGEAWCWGSNGGGQLGVGHEYGREEPTRVADGHRYRSISAGGYTGGQDVVYGKTNTCAVSVGGESYCWGLNSAGQVGNGVRTVKCHVDDPHVPTFCEPRPTRVAAVSTFESISAGGSFACGIGGDGILYCWGSNEDGQLGIGGEHMAPAQCGYGRCALEPVRVSGQPDGPGAVP